MFSWTRTFYAERNGFYFCFEAKRNRDDAVKRYGFNKVSAAEVYGNPYFKIEWRDYERWTK